MRLGVIIPRLVFGSIIFGVLYSLAFSGIVELSFPQLETLLSPDLASTLTFMFSWTVLFLLWSTGYLAYHYLRNYEREEIKNLRLQSSQNEVELASLKAQLNPHFIFNAMNSIRALVDEDPKLAKTAVTKLSNILRNSLMTDKRNLVSLGEELDLVKDHLSLEQIRYEERLRLSYDIDPEMLDERIPPLMIQTLVENAIKHGIAQSQSGGDLSVKAEGTKQHLKVEVVNTGKIRFTSNGTGIGLANLERRLNILYNGKATLTIMEISDNRVLASLMIPRSKEK
jgi:LytS/YehU family sensor histidine kinase